MQTDDFELVRPLSRTHCLQAFVAKDKQGSLVRLIRTLPLNSPEDGEELKQCIQRIRRATLVNSVHVLPIKCESSTYSCALATTAFVHDRSWKSLGKPINIRQAISSLAIALASSHKMGVSHGCISMSTIYYDTNRSTTNISLDGSLDASEDRSEVVVDLLDGILHDENWQEHDVDAISQSEDVRQFGALVDSLTLGSSDRDNRLQAMIESTQVPDWAARPSMEELSSQLNQWLGRTPSGVSSAFPLSSSTFGDAGTMEIAPNVVESLAKANLVPEGMVSIGRFAIERTLGEGGMGAVYLGRDRSSEQLVAIKVLPQRLVHDERATRRFAKEARLLSTVNHPCIAKLIEFKHDDESMYLAMEYVPGGCLADFTRTNRALDEQLVVAALADVARGLAVAHENGLLHRDIKPANLLLSEHGERSFRTGVAELNTNEPLIKLADFGLAKQFDGAESIELTLAGTVLGTPMYMSPEQCSGKALGPAADVYAFGITMFQCLCGKLPYEGNTPVEIMRQQCDAPIPSLQQVRSGISDSAQRIVEKCLAKNPFERYRDGNELLADLEGLLKGTPATFALHPEIPDAAVAGKLRYQYRWKMRSSPEALWPYVSNTDRVNHAIGLPAVKYRTFHDPRLGMRRMATVKAMGLTLEWEEHPYEWIEGRRLSVMRQFQSGPFHWFTNVVELVPQSDGGTLIVQTIEMLPRNLLGKIFAMVQIGAKSERNFGRVYERIDEYLRSNFHVNATSNPFSVSKQMTTAQRRRFEERFNRVRSFAKGIDPKVLEILEQYLIYATDLEIARIRPASIAERFGLNPGEVVEVCLLAAREGVLILLWDILCPTCRIPSDVQETLKNLADHGHCQACNADFELDFAQSIEMIFRVHPEIRSSETRTYCIGGPAFSSHVVAQIRLSPNERLTVPLNLSDGQYRLRGAQLPFVVDFRVGSIGRVGHWDIELSQPVLKQDVPNLRSGEQVLTFSNTNPDPKQIRIERMASRADAFTAADAARLPAFREWFPDEVLSPGQMISLTTVTLLGCRIADISELYESMSEQAACSTVIRNLQSIASVVESRGGCVFKTKNDGLVVVFPNSTNAIQAACEIATQSKQWNIVLQQAIHQGPTVLATINDRLDYFGQTPLLLDAMLSNGSREEIWMTDSCWNEAGLPDSFQQTWAIKMIAPLSGWPNSNIIALSQS